METTTVAKDSVKTIPPDTNKIYNFSLSKNVYITEIDKVEPKLWGFTCVSLILGHPVQLAINPIRLASNAMHLTSDK